MLGVAKVTDLKQGSCSIATIPIEKEIFKFQIPIRDTLYGIHCVQCPCGTACSCNSKPTSDRLHVLCQGDVAIPVYGSNPSR